MAHNIDMTNNRANIAFLGSRNDIWHRLGQEMKDGMSIEEWAKAAGLEWTAIKVPAYAYLSADVSDKAKCEVIDGHRLMVVEGQKHIVRSDNGHALGYVSDRYQPVQPSEILDWFRQYISVDDRFRLDVAGSLKQGEIIWATATFNGEMSVGGDKHVARLLMTTTYDGTGATINQGTMTRVVCNNTLDAALSCKNAKIKTRHNTKFNAERVSNDLSNIAQSFKEFQKMGDAMATVQMAKDEVSRFFKAVLDIPFETKQDEISTRKLNQFYALNDAYKTTVAEGTKSGTAWCALNAVTRYVDHDKSTRSGDSRDEARFLSSQFGSGSNMKEKAVELLKDLLPA